MFFNCVLSAPPPGNLVERLDLSVRQQPDGHAVAAMRTDEFAVPFPRRVGGEFEVDGAFGSVRFEREAHGFLVGER
jgi:hypothetical protein